MESLHSLKFLYSVIIFLKFQQQSSTLANIPLDLIVYFIIYKHGFVHV